MTNNTWTQTYTGGRFDIADPKPVWDIREIAHVLSMKCRFGGHCGRFYSVAEHSVYVSRYTEDPIWGLLHDAAETYLPDSLSPMKTHPMFYGICQVETLLLKQVRKKWNLGPYPRNVKVVDKRILVDEHLSLMSSDLNKLNKNADMWPANTEPLGVEIKALSPHYAKELFLSRAVELGLWDYAET